MSEGVTKRPITDWRASRLRVTAFPAPDAPYNNHDLWAELAAATTDLKSLGERESQETKKGKATTTQGPALDNWLIITTTSTRIDWIYLPKPDESEGEDFGFRDVGAFVEVVDRFAELVGGWIDVHCPRLTRFAFGATIRIPIKDRIEGYTQLSAYLPFQIDENTSSDFLYQINRRRPSNIDRELEINRLTKWSVAALTRLGGELLLSPSGVSSTVKPYASQSACQVEMDFNSHHEYVKGFEKGQVRTLLREFVDMAKETAAEGDIP